MLTIPCPLVLMAAIPRPVKSDSFNAQPEAPAFFVAVPRQAGASGWALNEEMGHSSPGAV